MTQLAIYQVDSFASKPFEGNPAGVCILDSPLDEQIMQQIALEMNLAETAFVIRVGDHFRLRWFTPETEVDLCGHATLATAHMLWENELLGQEQVAEFETRSGRLVANRMGDSIRMDFPSQPPVPADPHPLLFEALGVSPIYTGFNNNDYLVEVASESELRSVKPDFGKLLTANCRGVIVTCKSEQPKYDFVSRFFAPAVGVNEDPVTGSAHCCLTPYWSERLGKSTLKAYQASQRGGELTVSLAGDRVILQGNAVTVLRGNLEF